MGLYDKQYYPLQLSETDANAAVSTRMIRDLSTGINNYKAHYGPVLIADAFPDDHVTSSTADNGAEVVILRFAPRFVSGGYNRISWGLSGKMSLAAQSCTWRLYAGQNYYNGDPDVSSFTTADWGAKIGIYFKSELSFSSVTQAIKTATDLVCFPDRLGRIYLLLTASNSSTADCGINSMTAKAWING